MQVDNDFQKKLETIAQLSVQLYSDNLSDFIKIFTVLSLGNTYFKCIRKLMKYSLIRIHMENNFNIYGFVKYL